MKIDLPLSFSQILYFVLAAVAVLLAIRAIGYFFTAMGLYTIAKRREIACPWLAWIPVANQWTLGSIYDDYKWMVSGDYTKMRITLLVFAILEGVGVLFDTYVWNNSDALEQAALFAVFGIPILIIEIVAFVFQCKAYYSLYASCKPKGAVLLLVLSIIFPFLLPFFIFACRKCDDGLYITKYKV